MSESKSRQTVWSIDGRRNWIRAVNNIRILPFGVNGEATILGRRYRVQQNLTPLVPDSWRIAYELKEGEE